MWVSTEEAVTPIIPSIWCHVNAYTQSSPHLLILLVDEIYQSQVRISKWACHQLTLRKSFKFLPTPTLCEKLGQIAKENSDVCIHLHKLLFKKKNKKLNAT